MRPAVLQLLPAWTLFSALGFPLSALPSPPLPLTHLHVQILILPFPPVSLKASCKYGGGWVGGGSGGAIRRGAEPLLWLQRQQWLSSEPFCILGFHYVLFDQEFNYPKEKSTNFSHNTRSLGQA